MEQIDWWVIGGYIVGMLLLAMYLGRTQSSGRDYFLGANQMHPLALASSTVATQCSTNSLLGAPAFVGFTLGGGLLWLQYELAVPIAMLLLIWLLAAVRTTGHISIYAFLEERLGPDVRLLASTMFLVFRGIATGVTVYGVAAMMTLVVDMTYTQAVFVLMGVTIAYDVLGGMRAVVISDALQLILIMAAVLGGLVYVVDQIGGLSVLIDFQQQSSRGQAVAMSWGLDGSGNFGFWPMLFGGLFLYMAYYGCDQSQAQRVLASRTARDAEAVLVYSGLLRFPIVFVYCMLGLALAIYSQQTPEFIAQLPQTTQGQPNFNLVFPAYVLTNFPPGLIGLVLVGIVAAAMSSIDSSLNSLSAATMEDHLSRWAPDYTQRHAYLLAKLITMFWGLFAVGFSYQVEAIAPTILEAINKIGSVANGPLLALFVMALLMRGMSSRVAIAAFVVGFLANISLWLWLPQVSWLWWNVVGCVIALVIAVAVQISTGKRLNVQLTYQPGVASKVSLIGMFILILATATLMSLGHFDV